MYIARRWFFAVLALTLGLAALLREGHAQLPDNPDHERSLAPQAKMVQQDAGVQLPPKLAILPIKLLDTSAEPTDQSADHARRLETMASGLAVHLQESGLYQTVKVEPDALRLNCRDEAPECLLKLAREGGARLVFVAVVQKSSTLILRIWARIVDAETGKVAFSRDLNFRGDTDEAWRRAEAFLVDQLKAAPIR